MNTKIFSNWFFLKFKEKTVLRPSRGKKEKFNVHKGLDWIGTIQADGFLVSNKGNVWPVRSGPHGRGALPDGTYQIGWPVGQDKIKPKYWEYWKDKNKNIWFASLKNSEIKRQTGRSRFGIHPDGGTPGTMGCVGVRIDNTLPVKKAIESTPKSLRKLKVKYVTESEIEDLWLKAQGL